LIQNESKQSAGGFLIISPLALYTIMLDYVLSIYRKTHLSLLIINLFQVYIHIYWSY